MLTENSPLTPLVNGAKSAWIFRVYSMTGHHETLISDETVKPPSEKSFGITFAVVFALLAAWLYWRKDLPFWSGLLAVASLGSLAAGYLAPGLLRPLNIVWLKFGLILHRIVNPIVMGFLFFIVFTPMALIMRLLGKDPMKRAREPSAASYWSKREESGDVSMKNQF